MNVDNDENNRSRPREDEEEGNNNGEGGNDRNVQQRTDVLIPRTGSFREKLQLSVGHLQVVDRQSSNNSKSISPTLTMRSLQQHMVEGGGHGSAMIFIITSINTASASGRTQVQMQRGPSGRNQLNQVSHSRTIHLLDPNSESGSNMAVMFHGSGNNTRMLSGDTSIVNDGTLRKCLSAMASFFVILCELISCASCNIFTHFCCYYRCWSGCADDQCSGC